MNNFYKGGRGLAFSHGKGETSFRKEKPPGLSNILPDQVVGKSSGLPSATVRQVVDVSSRNRRDLSDTCSGGLREVFGSCSGFSEAHPNNTRRNAEGVPNKSRSGVEAHPKDTRTASEETRSFFHCFLGTLKEGNKYRCSKDIVLFTQLLRKRGEVQLMYQEYTVNVRGVYRKGTKEVLGRYWRATKDLLSACTSGVDQRYSKRRRAVEVEPMTKKVTLFLTGLLCFSRKLLTLMALKNKAMPLVLALIWFSFKSLFFKATKNKVVLPYGLLCFMLFNLSNAWAQSAETRTAERQTEIGPMIMGQKLPDEFWTKEHLFYTRGDTVRGTLEQYKGNLLILDFWATWCGPCLAGINNLNNWQTNFPEITFLLVSVKKYDDNLGKITNVLSNPKGLITEEIRMSSILQDEYLSSLFPSTSVPLYIWINRKGRIHALTSSYFMNQKQLQQWIALQ